MSVFSDLLDSDRNAVFLNADEFAESVDHLPKGSMAAKATVLAVFSEDKLQGSNEVDGDGVTPESRMGSRIRMSAMLALSSAVSIDDRDQFIIRGQRWYVRRVVNSDGVMQTLLINRVDKISTRTPRTVYQ